MNVKELIAELKKCEPTAEVVMHNGGFFVGTRRLMNVAQYNHYAPKGPLKKVVHLS